MSMLSGGMLNMVSAMFGLSPDELEKMVAIVPEIRSKAEAFLVDWEDFKRRVTELERAVTTGRDGLTVADQAAVVQRIASLPQTIALDTPAAIVEPIAPVQAVDPAQAAQP